MTQTTSHDHHIAKCRYCMNIVTQCRCMSADKKVEWVDCGCRGRKPKADDERWSHDNLMSSLGDSKTVAQVEWLNLEIKRRHPTICTTDEYTEMLASIRNELCRLAEIQRRLFKAQNTLNTISRDVQEYWQP